MSKRAVALIVAAGESRRAGGDIPKQYQMLGDKSLLRRSIEAFLDHPGIWDAKVVVHPAHMQLYREHTQGLPLLEPAEGGQTRQESVMNGLKSLAESAEAPDWVLVHDAARPNVSYELISDVLARLEKTPAVIPALPVIDTLKHVEEERVVGTIERAKLFRAQTPQGFHFPAIYDAHKQCDHFNCTDDAAVAEHAGLEVSIMPGSEHNYKITTAEDMRDAQALVMSQFEMCVGQGMDAHRLVPHDDDTPLTQRTMKLCGIDVPFDMKLEGHSDADVALHAVVDALLGAMGEGDIGAHFSPADPRWRGANSSRFVLHAYQLMRRKHGVLNHLDVTIVCEKPAIAPHRKDMIEMLSKLLDTSPRRISVKATTMEKMGFTGRGEGIAAYAVATLRMPARG